MVDGAARLHRPVDGEASDRIDVPISALEHYSYCPRQCALIHVEQTFDENQFTIRGRIAHERVDSGEERSTRGVRSLRSIPLWSDDHGLIGRSDVVEMRPSGPFPVEYKVGRRRAEHADIQLCAQALCLEEMLNETVRVGALYFRQERKRYEVRFDESLRVKGSPRKPSSPGKPNPTRPGRWSFGDNSSDLEPSRPTSTSGED